MMMNLDKLTEYLKEQSKDTIMLSFAEIEEILGEELPVKAKKEQRWWWNIKDSKKAQAWMNCGYYTYNCNNIPMRGNVCFKKNNAETAKEIKGIIRLWYFLFDKDAELHQKVLAFLEILILPLIAFITMIISFFSLLSPNTNTTINNYYESVKSDSQVEIVNIDILKDRVYIETETIPTDIGVYIDIKLRNKGDTVAFLKQIKFEVEEIFPIDDPRDINYSAVPVSEIYDVILDDKSTQIIDISQSVPANGVDRFRLKIMSSEGINDMDVI